jgi:hypothetical protein
MIIYLLIGTFWTMLVEYFIRPRVSDLEMNWPTRIFNILLWPLNVGLFIYGFLVGVDREDEE